MGAAPRVATVLALLAISAAAAPAQTKGEAEKSIRAADAAWLKAYAAKDVDQAVVSLDDEGAMLAPNAPMATGKGAVRKSIAAAFAIPGHNLVWHIAKLDVAASGDLGITNGPSTRASLLQFGKNSRTVPGKCFTTCSVPTCPVSQTRPRPREAAIKVVVRRWML